MKTNNFVVSTRTLLATLLVATTLILSSCSKDSILDRVKRDVDDSEWSATHYGNQYYLSFDDGQYILDYTYDGRRVSIDGRYTQKGVNITFQEIEFLTSVSLVMKNGNITQIGSEMIVPLYDSTTGNILYTLNFQLDYLDD